MFYFSTSSLGFIPTCSSRRREKKENEFDEKKCIRSRRTFFLIFDVCDMFFFSVFSLFNWKGSCFVEGFGFRRSRGILVGCPFIFVGVCRGEGHVAERRKEGKRKRSLSTY